jgi:hypothetical protein
MAYWSPIWLSRLLSHQSSRRTVHLTLVLLLSASAELQPYRTSLPHLIISRTIWSEWTQPRCWLVLHWNVWYEATKLLWGSMVFKEVMSPIKKQRIRRHVIWCLPTNIRANRVAIVSSIITKIFNPCKHWTIMIQPSVFYVKLITYSDSLPVSCYCLSVVWLSFISVLFLFGCFWSIIQCLIIRLFSVVFCPDTGIVFQVYRSTTIRQVNKHHTSDSAIFCLSVGSESLFPS